MLPNFLDINHSLYRARVPVRLGQLLWPAGGHTIIRYLNAVIPSHMIATLTRRRVNSTLNRRRAESMFLLEYLHTTHINP